MAKKKVAIVGGGIIGAAIAHELSRQNADVTLFDAGRKVAQATLGSFGWINAHNHHNEHHFRLRLESIHCWQELARQHRDIPVRFIPAIDWDMPTNEMADTVSAYNRLGYESAMLSLSDLKERFPNLSPGTDYAIVCPGDAVAVPEKIGEFFATQARNLGAKVIDDCEVSQLIPEDNSITGVVLNDQTHEFDAFVIAAGCGSTDILNPLGIELPMDNRSGLLVRTNSQPKLIDAIVSAPEAHFWQMEDGTILAGENQAGETEAEDIEAFSHSLIAKLKRLLPGTNNLCVENHSLGIRPQPLDGMPVMGATPQYSNLHLAVMHSGITLAPVVAKMISDEIMYDANEHLFAPYRLNRFEQSRRALAS
ncbi:MAG: FAD-dependent oxidoreductase [Pseudomonadota bacterium]